MAPNLPSDKELVSFCKEHCSNGNRLVRLTDTIIIKFGFDVTLPEVVTQQYVWEYTDRNIFHVPEPYRFFQEGCIGYFVMEYINGISMSSYLENAKPTEQEAAVHSIVKALDHLTNIPVPDRQGPGPLSNGPPRGYLWSDGGIISSFNTIPELENWLNQLLESYQPNEKMEYFDFKKEKLVMCHTDLAPRNILRTAGGQIAILDWGFAGFYPPIFEIYAFRTRIDREPVFRQILDQLGQEQEDQIQLLAKVEKILLLYGGVINAYVIYNIGENALLTQSRNLDKDAGNFEVKRTQSLL